MFHKTTTLWHQSRFAEVKFGENRMVYGEVWEGVKNLAKDGWRILQKGKRGIGIITWPMRAPMIPVWWSLKKTAELGGKAIQKTREGVWITLMGAKAARKLGPKQVLRLVGAPLLMAKTILVGNTRAAAKAVFSLPVTAAKTPWALGKGYLWEAPQSAFHGAVDVAKSVATLNPMNVLRATRDAIGKTLLPDSVREIGKEYLELPKEIAENYRKGIVDVHKEAIMGGLQDFREGWAELQAAPAEGKKKADDIYQEGVAEKEKAKEIAEEEGKKSQGTKEGGGKPGKPKEKAAA